MSKDSLIAIAVIVAYFILNFIIIKSMTKKQESLEEFGVGNRSFGWLLNAFSYIGGWYTGSIYIGWFANASGLGVFSQYVIIYSISSLFIMFFMARPVWILGKNYNLVTQADLIELRYGSKKFKFVFAILTFLFWVPWLIIEIRAIGYVVQAATYQAIGFNIGLIVVSAFVIGYCFFGGSKASAVGGLVQGITFTVVGVIAVYWLITKAYGGGGFDNLYDIIEHEINNPALLQLTFVGGRYWFSVVFTCTLAGYIIPGVFASIYRADSSRAVKKAVTVAPFAGIAIGFTILSLGLGLSRFSGDPTYPVDPQSLAFWVSDKFGGPIMLGLMGILALAACMSTISAVINTASVLISKDIVGTIVPRLNKEKLFKWARILTIGVGIVAILIATLDIPNLMNIALLMYDCSVQAFPAVFIGLFWKKANLPGVSLGFAVGVICSLIGTISFFAGISPEGYITIIPFEWPLIGGFSFGTVGVWLNAIIILVCGLFGKKYERTDEIFDTVKNYKEVFSNKVI